jgi:DnaJ-class molecular chaperone
MSKHTVEIELHTDNGEEETFTLPSKNIICDRCEGHGSYVNPNIDGNGITGDEWAQWSDEEQETYLSGGYDVTCEDCNGNGTLQVPDVEACNANQLDILKRYNDKLADEAKYDAECASEIRMLRRMGGDWQ